MARPDRRRRRPLTRTAAKAVAPPGTTDRASVTDLAARRAPRGRCPRCGVPFRETTLETLGRCTELAYAGLARGTGTDGTA